MKVTVELAGVELAGEVAKSRTGPLLGFPEASPSPYRTPLRIDSRTHLERSADESMLVHVQSTR